MQHRDTHATRDRIHAARMGDKKALEELLLAHRPRLVTRITRKMDKRLLARTTADDIAQDTLLTAVRLLPRFEMRDGATFHDWLAKISDRKLTDALDKLRSKKANPNRESTLLQHGDKGPQPIEIESGDRCPMQRATRLEDWPTLYACLAELPARQRESIVLRDLLGLPHERVAELTARPTPDAARAAHQHARACLERAMRAATPGSWDARSA